MASEGPLPRNHMRTTALLIALITLLLAGCTVPPVTQFPSATPEPPSAVSTSTPIASPVLQTVVPTTQARGCSIASPEPTAAASELFPPPGEEDYSVGPADAAVTLVEYCDFQAPICRSMAAVVSNVVNNHRADVRVIFRPVPLIGRLDKSELAVQA